jgi:anhydro-N-acetylmuramic acid kinase
MDNRELFTGIHKAGIGVMSGTSLDGIDLVYVDFSGPEPFTLLHFSHIPYTQIWIDRLASAHQLSGLDLKLLERDYSEYTAQLLCNFIEVHRITVDFIGCHGHTIFHQPDESITHQMIDGSILAARTGCTVVCDFRSLDVALGGQGAPLVPIGDELLYGKYDACLNLGGFANISYRQGKNRKAYDISPANIILNHLALQLGKNYDDGGKIASSGKVITHLLDKLNELPYYRREAPKSLGREWIETNVLPLLKDEKTEDLMATAVVHIAAQVAKSINAITSGEILCTGGGCHNKFLMKEISNNVKGEILIPTPEIVDNKEAIIFALLALLRLEEKTNTLASVTGAKHNSCGGAVYLPH